MLDEAREIAGVTFVITSGLRSKTSNTAAGGVKNSLHEVGLAVDIRAPRSPLEALKMAFALGAAGFKQAGFYDGHFHVELDPKDTYALWSGKSH